MKNSKIIFWGVYFRNTPQQAVQIWLPLLCHKKKKFIRMTIPSKPTSKYPPLRQEKQGKTHKYS